MIYKPTKSELDRMIQDVAGEVAPSYFVGQMTRPLIF